MCRTFYCLLGLAWKLGRLLRGSRGAFSACFAGWRRHSLHFVGSRRSYSTCNCSFFATTHFTEDLLRG
jgi:hypothetical protein